MIKKLQTTHPHKRLTDYIHTSLMDIFLRFGFTTYHGSLITITEVLLSPDKRTCKIYISALQSSVLPELMKTIRERQFEITTALNQKLKNKMRFMPSEYFFYEDITAERASRVTMLIDQLNIK